jgi:CRP-like cAMP-binding protein
MEKETDRQRIAEQAAILWEPLTEEQRELFTAHAEVRTLHRGETLYREGDAPRYLFCLLRGHVTIQRNGRGGQQQIVRMVEPGAIFGYAASFANSDYLSTAIAGHDTEVLLMPASLMFHFIWENSNFAMLFLRELSELLGLTAQRTISLTQKHIRGRLAEALMLMRKKYGLEDDGQTLSVYLSREDLGKLSNMTTSNAIRTLSAFASEGIIAIEGRKLKLLDEHALQRISQLG